MALPSQLREEDQGGPGFWEDILATYVLLENQAAPWDAGLKDEGGDYRTVCGPRVGLPGHSSNKQMFTEHLLCAKPCAECWDAAENRRKFHVELGVRGQWKRMEEMGTTLGASADGHTVCETESCDLRPPGP